MADARYVRNNAPKAHRVEQALLDEARSIPPVLVILMFAKNHTIGAPQGRGALVADSPGQARFAACAIASTSERFWCSPPLTRIFDTMTRRLIIRTFVQP